MSENKSPLNGILKHIKEIIAVFIVISGIVGSWFVLKSTVSQQGDRIRGLELSDKLNTDRLARLETKVDMILDILKQRNN